jgi:mRNA-degrading endonuclease YafQ of YafQ-DinJ toxin-antitoxin module
MKILLVEDEIEMQKKYHSLLRAWKEYRDSEWF